MSRSPLPGPHKTTAFLGLGGNIGDPRAAMAAALSAIEADPDTHISAVSSLYRTPPWGKTDQPDFLNAVARVETGLRARALLQLGLSTETALRRVRRERWGPRLIDIDVLVYGDATIDEDGLQVPHPRMGDRAFVMVPLAEIAPDWPVGGETAARIAARLPHDGIEAIASQDWWKA